MRLYVFLKVNKHFLFLIVIVGFVFSTFPNTLAAVIDISQNDVALHKCTGSTCSVEQSEIASRITRYRDANINPCDNFYGFACGNYKKTNQADEDYHLGALRNEKIKKLIQKGISSDAKPYKLIDDIYKTCVNKNTQGQQALDLMKRIIRNLGNWPVLEADKWKEADFNWIDFTSNAKKIGYNINYFLDWKPKFTSIGQSNTLKYVVKMSPNDFEYFMAKKSTSQRQIYTDYRLKMIKFFGATGDFAKEMKEAFDFEDQLLKINTRESYPLNNFRIEELQKRWPSIDWTKFVEKILTPFIDADGKPIMTIWNASALTEFADIILKTPKRVQANYAMWKIFQYSIPYLTKELTDAQKQFYKQVEYPEVTLEDSCVAMVKNYAGFALEYLYLEQHKSSQAIFKTMAEVIKNEIIKMVKKSERLNDNTKVEGIKAIKEISLTIGPSNKLSDPKELENYYVDARVVKDNLLQTILNLNLFNMKKTMSIRIRSEFPLFSIEPDDIGYPQFSSDRINIPAAMIPGPFFDKNRPMYMNFGASGSYMAFGFTDFLSRKRNQTDLKKQIECFHHYYDDLSNETMRNNLHRNRFEEDLLAQHLSFRSSWAAYQTYSAQHGAEASLPSLPYSPNQLFWISFAQSSCSEYSKLSEPRTVNNNQFHPIEYVMMKILSTIPEISNDFQCLPGSNLNPVHKCPW